MPTKLIIYIALNLTLAYQHSVISSEAAFPTFNYCPQRFIANFLAFRSFQEFDCRLCLSFVVSLRKRVTSCFAFSSRFRFCFPLTS